MDKFTFVIDGPTLGNPYLEDTFFRSCVQRHFHQEKERDDIHRDFLLFGHRLHTDLLVKSNDGEENPPKFKQINVYGEHVNDIQLTMGWKMQAAATVEEGLVSIPYPFVDNYGYLKPILGQLDSISNNNTAETDWNALHQNRDLLNRITTSFLANNNTNLIPNNIDIPNLPPKPVYQHSNLATGRARLHAFMKNLLYTPSSSMQSCPNAMTDGFSRLMTQMFLNPKLFGQSQSFQKKMNHPSLHPRVLLANINEVRENGRIPEPEMEGSVYRALLRAIPFDELLTIQATHYALATTTSKTSENPMAAFQPAYTTPISVAYSSLMQHGAKIVYADLNQDCEPEIEALRSNTLRTIFTPRDATGVNKNVSTQANPDSKRQPRRKADYIPHFGGSGQWMTSARGGSDVSSGSTAIALPLSFNADIFAGVDQTNIYPTSSPPSSSPPTPTPSTTTGTAPVQSKLPKIHQYKFDQGTNTIQSQRIFGLYGLKYFTSAIDSKFTITLARVLTEETWDLACQKLNRRHKTTRFSQISKPAIFNKILIPDPNHHASATYSCKGIFPYADFTIGSSFNSNNQNPNMATSPSPPSTKRLVLNTNHGEVMDNLDPLHQILQNIPLTCFLIYIKSDDNILNNITLQRLKEKLGTKQLPTAELLLGGSIALRISEYGRGVPLISLLFNLSRLHNSISACGYPARLLMLNRSYAKKRYVFGSHLTANPAHLNTLSTLTTYSWLITNSTLELSSLQGVVEAVGVIRHYYEKEFNLPYQQWAKSTAFAPTITKAPPSNHINGSRMVPFSSPTDIGQKLFVVGEFILSSIYNLFLQMKHSLSLPTPDFQQFNPNQLDRITFLTKLTSSTAPPGHPAQTIETTKFHQLITSAHQTLLSILPQLETLLRISTPISKLSTAEYASTTATQLTQLFGALGYMEDSRIPRLLRDTFVLAIWEGTKSVCAHDFIRAITYRPLPPSSRQSSTKHADPSLQYRVIDVGIITLVKQIVNAKIDRLKTVFNTVFPPSVMSPIGQERAVENHNVINTISQLEHVKIVKRVVPVELLNVLEYEFPFITTQMVLDTTQNMFRTTTSQIKLMLDQWVAFLLSIESTQMVAQVEEMMTTNSSNHQSDPKSIVATVRRAKQLILEQHCVSIAQGLYQIQSVVSLLEHAMYYMTLDQEQSEMESPESDSKNDPSHQHVFFKRLQITQTYGLPILFACYRLVADSPYLTMGGANNKGWHSPLNQHQNSPPSPRTPSTPFINSSQLSLGYESTTASSTSALPIPQLATTHLYRLLNQLIAMDELPLLPVDQLLQSRL